MAQVTNVFIIAIPFILFYFISTWIKKEILIVTALDVVLLDALQEGLANVSIWEKDSTRNGNPCFSVLTLNGKNFYMRADFWIFFFFSFFFPILKL